MPNPDDIVRDSILRALYDVHRRARSPRSASVGIRDLTAVLRTSGLKQQQVAHNLDYLIQKGWVREVARERSFTTPRGTRQSAEQITYKISDVGIDTLESASTYQRPATGPHVNITNIHGVTVVGDGNVVNATYTDLASTLNQVRQAVLSSSLPDEQKLDVAADIDTLQAQLQKPAPDKSIVRTVWAGIERIVTAAEFGQLAFKLSELVRPLL